MKYHVRIHETRAYSFYAEAESPEQAGELAHEAWLRGEVGDEMQEESIDHNIAAVEPITDTEWATGDSAYRHLIVEELPVPAGSGEEGETR